MRWPKRTPLERFLKHVRKTEACWIWTGAKHSKKGYGSFTLPGKTGKAHRAAWILHFGNIPKGLFVLHKCDNPTCVNPKHLFLGTNVDNMADMVKKGRSRGCSFPGEKSSTAKLTNEDVIKIRQDKRRKKEIAAAYGVHQKTIIRIQLRQAWKHL